MNQIEKSSTFVFIIAMFLLVVLTFSIQAQEGVSKPATEISFTKSSQVFDPSIATIVEFADIDHDNDLDLIQMPALWEPTRIWLNDGKGNFSDSGQRLTKQGHGIQVADLNGDGHPDLFITCAGLSNSDKSESYVKSSIYLNDGKGVFRDSGQDLGDLKLSGTRVDLHDYDLDGDLDAFIGYYPTEDKIYVNDGTGKFQDKAVIFPEGTTISDLDKDGDVDYFSKEAGKGLETQINDGKGNFATLWQLPDSNAVRSKVSLGDLDNDGDLDAFITRRNFREKGLVQVFFNDGSGRFKESDQKFDITLPAVNELADLNLDGHLDVLIKMQGAPDQIWLNNGKGRFVDSGVRLGGDERTIQSAFGDIDNDGDLDIIIAHFPTGSTTIWLNQLR